MLQLKPSDKGRGPTLEIFLDEAHNKWSGGGSVFLLHLSLGMLFFYSPRLKVTSGVIDKFMCLVFLI
jgi:hypothetical protein